MSTAGPRLPHQVQPRSLSLKSPQPTDFLCKLTSLHGVPCGGGRRMQRAVLFAVHAPQHRAQSLHHSHQFTPIRAFATERALTTCEPRPAPAHAPPPRPPAAIGARRPITALHFKRFPFSMSRSIWSVLMHLGIPLLDCKPYSPYWWVVNQIGYCEEICLFSHSLGCARAASATRAEENASRSSR